MALAGQLYNSSSTTVLMWNLYWTETSTSIAVKLKVMKALSGTVTVKLNGTTRLSQTFSSTTYDATYDVYTINKTHATQSVSFAIWHTGAQSGSYGGTNPNGTITVSAVPSYPVTYDVVGGSSVANQTKWENESLTIQAASTKAGYLFDTWIDSDRGTHAPGSSYTTNAALSLTAKYYKYAAFESYGTPIAAHRCQYSTPNVVDDEGTSCAIKYTIAYDYAMKTAKNTTVKIRAIAYRSGNTNTPFYTGSYTTITQTAPSSGTINYASGTYLLGASSTVFNTDSDYDIVLEVLTTFSGGSYTDTRNLRLEEAFFTMDIAAGGHCIGFGGPAYSYYGPAYNGDVSDGRGWILNYFRVAFLDDVICRSMVGTIQMFAGETPPRGWLICDGSYIARFECPLLYDLLGETWGPAIGSGDNRQIPLPDFRGRAPVGVLPLNSYSSTYPNLLRDEGENWTPSSYNAYILRTSTDLSTSTQYTLQLWDVDVFHSGKSTAADTNVSVYWGGGTVNLVKFICNNTASVDSTATLNSYVCNFTGTSTGNGTLYHAEYLEAVFTIGSTAGASPGVLLVYNSVANASGNMYLKIGRWQLTSGNHSKIPWTAPAYWYDKNKRKLLGSYGGTDEGHIAPEQLPAHVHGLNNHTHSISHQHGFGFASGQSIMTSNAGIGEHKVKSGSDSSNYYLSISSGDVQTSGKTATTTITTSTSGGNTSDTAASGSDWNRSFVQPYATVNFIICTGTWLDPDLGILHYFD